jgi:hypothetical protein
LLCEQPVAVPLDVCLRCGGPVLYADLSGDAWAVEAGPVPSMKFRQQAVAALERSVDGIDAARAEAALKDGRVRVVEGIGRHAAEGLMQRLNPQGTNAKVTRGPTPTLGAAGALAGGLPFAGVALGAVLGLAWNPIGWAIGGAVALGLAFVNMNKKLPVLASAPVGPLTDERVGDAARRYVAARGALGEAAARQLAAVVEPALSILCRLTDPDDVVALGAGGAEGGLGEVAVKLAERAVATAEGAVRAQRAGFEEAEAEAMGRLQVAADKALGQLTGGGEAVEGLESAMDEEVELVREALAELDTL